MNIEQYINLDSALIMIGFVGLLVIMVIYFGFRVASFLLDQQYASVAHEDTDEDEPPKEIPMAGQIWYPRLELEHSWLSPAPWPDEGKPSVKILEKRYDWIKYSEEGSAEVKYIYLHDFTKKFMKNEFGDIIEATVATPEPEPKNNPVEVAPIPADNIVKIDGKDFVLTPVKNDK